ncbi:MAG TPA: hypothetical protein VN622_08010 [Clostridia bacterium]|nr:hypothetical protein [Clostridia bacterium]
MKTISKVLAVALLIGLAMSVFAANSASLVLRNEATMNGTKLAAGEYKVTVDGTGSDVKVTFLQGSKVIATSSGTLVERPVAPEFSAVVLDKVNGVNTIQEIRLAKLKGSVLLGK